MAEFLNSFFFGIYPYIALVVLVVGSIVRYDRDPYTWKTGSSQLLRRKQLMAGSVMFHVGILGIFFGHVVGLLTPLWVWEVIGLSSANKQLIAVVAGGAAGALGIIGATLLIHRRFFDARVRATSSFADNGIILILWLQFALGLGTILVSIEHLDGKEMLKFVSWAQGIFTFNPDAADYIMDVAPIFKAHIFLGLTIFILFPFTRLVHMLSAPVRYIWRSGYQIVRTKRDVPPAE